ncbi:MAG: hypothetical protein ABJN04_11925 [Hyphomicrobiales bacterium]
MNLGDQSIETDKYVFTFEKETDDGMDPWGRLTSQYPDIYVRINMNANAYHDVGHQWVVHLREKEFGFMTDKKLSRAKVFLDDDGIFTWVFNEVCCAIDTLVRHKDRKGSYVVIHASKMLFENLDEQDETISVLEAAIRVYGGGRSGPKNYGRLKFGDLTADNLKNGMYLK